MPETRPPRVFISYSHDTAEHQQRVLALADRLRVGGIDAEIDQYHPAPPEGWALWCERQIETADFVLMICTETYHRRVRGDEVSGHGLGVVWEARIIRQLLYDAGAVSSKFIPLLCSGGASAHIPTPVKGGTRYVVDTEDGYENLYRRLTNQPEIVRPDLGKLRPLPPRQPKWTEDMAGQSAQTAAAPQAERTVTAMGNRGVAIGGNVTGTAIVTGDHNVTDVRYREVTLPPAESVDIRAELAALKELLVGLNTQDRAKIANALAEAESDAAKPQADKDEIGGALERALRYAGKAADFGEKAERIGTHVARVVGWLGDNWHKLLPLVGLAA